MGANWGFVGSQLLAALSPLNPYMTGMRISLALMFVLYKMAFYTSANTHVAGCSQADQLPNAGVASMAEPPSPLLFETQM